MAIVCCGVFSVGLFLLGCLQSTTGYVLGNSRECQNNDMRPINGTSCRYFEICRYHQWDTRELCPSGLLFNIDAQVCDWSYNVDPNTCKAHHGSVHTGGSSLTTVTTLVANTTSSHHGTQCGSYECFHGQCGYKTDCDKYGRCNKYHHCFCSNNANYIDSNCRQYIVYHSYCENKGIHCLHGGDCVYDSVDSYNACHCKSGYTGSRCELQIVSDNFCSHCYNGHCTHCYNGHCVHDPSTYTNHCHCSDGYTGDQCNLHILSSSNDCYYHNFRCEHGQCMKDTRYQSTYACKCDPGYTGRHCDVMNVQTTTQTPTTTHTITTTTTPTSSPTTPTTSTMTTTTQTTSTPLINYYTCQKETMLLDLGNQIPQTNPNVTHCSSGSDATPEAFVMDLCNTPLPPSWTEGVNVMQHCSAIPMFTPVATFVNHRYSSTEGFSGIFVGCLPNGFKLGAQPCDKVPTILHLESGGIYRMDPDQYYTVM